MIKLKPFDPIYSEVFNRIISRMDNTSFYAGAGRDDGMTLAYSYANGNLFCVNTDHDEGSWVRIYIDDNKHTTLFIEDSFLSFRLPLAPGVHKIMVEQCATPSGSTISKDSNVVYITRYALLLRAYAKELYQRVHRVLDDHRLSLLSPWSTRRVEHLMPHRNLMLASGAARTLCSRLTLRGMLIEPGEHGGVVDFLSGLSYNTPLIERSLDFGDDAFDPRINVIMSPQEQFGGYDFHTWVPNKCANEWATFIRLRDALKDKYDIKSVNEYQAVIEEDGGMTYTHTFKSNEASCFIGPLTNMVNLFDKIVMFMRMERKTRFIACPWTRPLDNLVVNPLGGRLLDTGSTLDSDMLDKNRGEDPLGDRWMWYKTMYRHDLASARLDSNANKILKFSEARIGERSDGCRGIRPLYLMNEDTTSYIGVDYDNYLGTFSLDVRERNSIWIEPQDIEGEYHVWGIRGGICFTIYPTPVGVEDWRRGMLLIGYERNGTIYFVNQVSLRSTRLGVESDSGLDTSDLDGTSGLRIDSFPGDWRESNPPAGQIMQSSDVSPGAYATFDDTERIMQVQLRFEEMSNGTRPWVIIQIDADKEYEPLSIITRSVDGYPNPEKLNVVLSYCSLPRLRLAQTQSSTSPSLMWPGFMASDLSSIHEITDLYENDYMHNGENLYERTISLVTDEDSPESYYPYSGTTETRQLLSAVFSDGSLAAVAKLRGRYYYRGTIVSIPNGVSIEEVWLEKTTAWTDQDRIDIAITTIIPSWVL